MMVLDYLFERRPPFDMGNTVAAVADLAKSYRVGTVYGDDYGADLTVTAFRREHITYRTLKIGDAEGGGHVGKLTRSEIYLNSVGLFTSGRVRLLDGHPRLVHQLISLQRRASRSSGRDTVDHPPSGHDDLANAVCGLLVALAGRGAPLRLAPEQRDAIAYMPRNRFANRTPGDNWLRTGFRRDRFQNFNP